MAFLQIDESTRLFYARHGSGAPPLVLVHGLGCAHEDWSAQVAHFGARHTVVTPDLRAHGRSARAAASLDMPSLGADVAALAAALGLEPGVLVGHSMGCRVVLEAARQAPERVAALVLVDGSRLASGAPEVAVRAARRAVGETGYRAFMDRLFGDMFLEGADPALRERVVARARRLPEPAGSELFARMVEWDAAHAEEALDRIEVPLLAVQSTYVDEARRRVPLAPGETTPWLDLLRERVPGARIGIVPGVGHFTMIEAPDALNAHIEALLPDLARSAGQ